MSAPVGCYEYQYFADISACFSVILVEEPVGNGSHTGHSLVLRESIRCVLNIYDILFGM